MGLLTLNELSGLGQTSWVNPQPWWGTYGPGPFPRDYGSGRRRHRRGLLPIPPSRPVRRWRASDFGPQPYGATVRVFDVRTMRSREVPIARISYMDSKMLRPHAKAKYDAWQRTRAQHRRVAEWARKRRALQTPTRVRVPARHQAVSARRSQEVKSLIAARSALTAPAPPARPPPVAPVVSAPRYAYSYVTPITPSASPATALRYSVGGAVASSLPMRLPPTRSVTGVY